MSNHLAEAAAIRAKALGFPDVESYLLHLIALDMTNGIDHTIPQILSQLPEEVQKRFDEALRRRRS